VRKVLWPATQQDTVFEVNRCRSRDLESHLHVVHAGHAEQVTNIFSNEIKVNFLFPRVLKVSKPVHHVAHQQGRQHPHAPGVSPGARQKRFAPQWPRSGPGSKTGLGQRQAKSVQHFFYTHVMRVMAGERIEKSKIVPGLSRVERSAAPAVCAGSRRLPLQFNCSQQFKPLASEWADLSPANPSPAA
jgi:hypothetical protein